MKRILFFAASFLLITASAPLARPTAAVALAPDRVHGIHGDVWVTNKSLNMVTVYDAATGNVRGVLSVGHTPIEAIIPSGTGKAYISNEGSNTVSVFDAATLAPLATIPMQAGPHHMMASRDGRFLYVGEFNQNTVGVIDTTTDTAIAHYVANPNVSAKTHAVFVSRDGSTLYATNLAANEIAALDAQTGAVEWRLGFDGTPSEVLLSKDGDLAYVSIRSKNALAIVDLRSHSLVSEFFIGIQPDTLRLTPDGKTVVIALRGTPAEMSLLDTRTLSLRFVDLPGTTTGHEWLSPNGKYTFIAIEGPGSNGSVALVNNETGTTEAVYAYPGGGKPHGVFYAASAEDEED